MLAGGREMWRAAGARKSLGPRTHGGGCAADCEQDRFAMAASDGRHGQFSGGSLRSAGAAGSKNDFGASEDVLRRRAVVCARAGLSANRGHLSTAQLSGLCVARV